MGTSKGNGKDDSKAIGSQTDHTKPQKVELGDTTVMKKTLDDVVIDVSDYRVL